MYLALDWNYRWY